MKWSPLMLAIDIGNSSMIFGMFSDQRLVSTLYLSTSSVYKKERFHTSLNTWLQKEIIAPKTLKNIVLSSVHPCATEIVNNSLVRLGFNPVLFDRTAFEKLPLHIPNKKELGSDIAASALAAHHLYSGNKVIVDFGTALTLTGLDETGHILGVNISPGINTSIRALASSTELLREVSFDVPKAALGTDTASAIQNGIIKASAGMIKYTLEMVAEEYGKSFKLIVTGGQSPFMTPLLGSPVILDRYLTLKGLHLFSSLSKNTTKH